MTNWTEDEILSTVKSIAEKAAESADFHARAIASPNEVIKEIAGRDVPADKTIRFVALNGADFAFVLPDPQAEGELSDSDLESVAGGRCNVSSVSVGYCR